MRSLEPPECLSADAADAWREVVAAYGAGASRIVGPLFEEFCEAIAQARRARRHVETEGIIVASSRGEAVRHPALDVERRALETIQRLAPQFAPPPRREGSYRDGYLVAATRRSVEAVPELARDEHAGAVAAVMTLAWVIDDAQRAGREQLRRAAFGPLQSYLRGLEALGLTPSVRSVQTSAGGDGAESVGTIDLDAWRQSREA